MTPFRSESLANGIVIEFIDRSNRYFGDYHRVCVEVCLTVSVSQDHAGEVAPPGTPRMFQQSSRLERMGVAGGEVAAVRDRLVENFLCHAGRYLAHADYPARLAAVHLASPLRSRLLNAY